MWRLVLGEAAAEFLREEGFFAACLGIKRQPGDAYGTSKPRTSPRATAVPRNASKIPV